MTPRKIRALFIASTLLILALALGFGSILSSGSFKKALTESYVSSFVLNGGESVRKIEYALKYGKQLDNFFGVQSILQEVKDNNADVKNIKIVLANGTTAYSLVEDSVVKVSGSLRSELLQMMRAGGRDSSWLVVDHQYHVLVAINDPTGAPIGAMDIIFDESVIAPHADAFEASIMQMTLMVGLAAALVLFVVLVKMQIVDPASGNLRTKRLLAVVLAVIGLAQTVLTAQAILNFQPIYLDTVQRNHALVGQLVQKNIAKVIAKGVPYADLEKLDEWMDAIPKAMPEIESIVLTSASPAPMFTTHRADTMDNAQYLRGLDSKNMTKVSLAADTKGHPGEAVIALSSRYIESKNRSIIIDALTLLVSTILFSVEIVLFLGIYFHAQALAHANANAGATPSDEDDTAIVRPQAFVFFLAASMSTSFLPVILKSFEPIAGLPENIFLSLLLSIELMASIVSTLVTGVVLDRRGWRPPFLAGLLILATGTLLSALASSTAMFLLARLVVGVGYGFAWMSLRGFVAAGKTSASQTTGFAGLNSGIYAGINCGVILGALLLERLSYSGIFWMSLVLTCIATVFCLCFTRNRESSAAVPQPQAAPGATGLLADGGIRIFFVTVAIPMAICLMFLNYFVPVYAKTVGISASDVGRLFLLYGLCVVYLGPVLSRTVIRRYSAKTSVGVSFVLIITGLLLFGFFPSALTCTVAVLLLGLSDGVGLVARNNYYLSFNAVKRFGVGKSMGVFSIVTKLGQTSGPLIFGWLSLVSMGVGMLGAAFAVLLLLFLLLPQSKPVEQR